MSGRIDREKPLPEVWRGSFRQWIPPLHRDQGAGGGCSQDDRPPTRKQEQFITKLVKYFPNVKELNEFSGYETKPTKANASSLITRALEENWSALQKTEGYMKYIATRPRAERLGGMVCLVMRTAWTWQRPWKNWTTTLERYGRTSSP